MGAEISAAAKRRIVVMVEPERGRRSNSKAYSNRKLCYDLLHQAGWELPAKNIWQWYKALEEGSVGVTSPDGGKWKVRVQWVTTPT